MDHAGAVMGPLIAFFFLTFITQQYRLLFWAAYLPGLVALIILIRGVSERQPTPTRVAAPRIQFIFQPFDSRFKIFLFIIILFSLGNSSDAFLLLKAKEAGVPVSLIPILWMVLHLVKSLSATPGGILSDRLGRRGVIIAGWMIYSGVYWCFAWAETPVTVWILFAIYGLFYGLTEGGERALVADLVEPNLRGTAYGLYHFSIGISTLPASILMGLLWEKVSSKAAFSFGAILALLAALLLWLFLRSGKRR
jgi:MFS family permease